jgi:diguanylate cyclase (GGDEF)-like protein/PAS domain S-box-containing protein
LATLGELIRWIGLVASAVRARIVRRYRRVLARLLRRDLVVARSERRFRALLESAPDAIVIVDWHGHIQLVNAQAERTFGYERDELVGQNMSRLMPKAHRTHHRHAFREYLRNATPRPMGGDLELFAVRKNGEEFPAEISLGPLETDQGILVCSVIRDVTDRKRAEAALREVEAEADAEERFRTAFEEAPVGIAVVGLDGSLQRINRALCEIAGYPREQLEAGRFAALLHPDDRPAAEAAFAGLRDGAESRYRVERRYVNASGETVPVEISAAVVYDADGAPLHVLSQVNDITERKRVERQLQYLADHDPLTGLYNRRRLEQELGRYIEAGAGGAVLAIDLDHFKLVNDTLGHAAGDELICRVAELLRGRLRATDLLARLGGDEFAVILPGAGPAQAVRVAEELHETLGDQARDAEPASPARWVTASIGIASLASGSTAAGPLVEADIAMYDAKEDGRNRTAVYDATLNRQGQTKARLDWTQRIRHALANDRFVLHAQPVLSLHDDPRPRYELLIRMRGDDGELILPGAFLDVAERVELIQSIDRWVISQAIGMLAQQRREGREPMLAINLSARSVTDPHMAAFVAGELTNAGIDGRGLCLEMTETAAVENIDRAQRFAHELSELGCEFALDDFGAGFATFYYLKHLRFDYLKIDGEFIRELATSRVNQVVVRSMIDIARGLGLRTIAEFVSDAETVEMLRGYGVDFAQGFSLAKPQPIDALELGRALVSPALAR